MAARVLSYSQYLLGIGHAVCSMHLANGLAKAGLSVDLVLGGVPVPELGGWKSQGVRIFELPPVTSGPGGFSDLRDGDGAPIDDAYRAARTEALLSLLDSCAPDVLLFEAFPFGRRQMLFELAPLLEAARRRTPKPLIVSSVRDILQEQEPRRRRQKRSKKPSKIDKTIETLKQYFDLVLVHGDEDFVRFDVTFPRAAEIASLVRYTGILSGPAPALAGGEPYDVVVSVGGGAVGERLLRCALDAHALTRKVGPRWCVLTGPNLPPEVSAALHERCPAGVELFAWRNDLAALMASARVSISQCGYNTAVDIFQSRCRSVLVPYAEHGETEQSQRAALMVQRGLATTVRDASVVARWWKRARSRRGIERAHELRPADLADAIDRAVALPEPTADRIPRLDGAETSARIILEALEAR